MADQPPLPPFSAPPGAPRLSKATLPKAGPFDASTLGLGSGIPPPASTGTTAGGLAVGQHQNSASPSTSAIVPPPSAPTGPGIGNTGPSAPAPAHMAIPVPVAAPPPPAPVPAQPIYGLAGTTPAHMNVIQGSSVVHQLPMVINQWVPTMFGPQLVHINLLAPPPPPPPVQPLPPVQVFHNPYPTPPPTPP
jgi:hypothetical protein